MAKHIHIWLPGSTRDADGPAHAPAGSSKGGQFVSGSGGGGGSSKKDEHLKQMFAKGKEHPDHKHHEAAHKAHSKAEAAETSASFYSKNSPPKSNPEYTPANFKAKAEKYKAEAAKHEANIGKKSSSPAPSSKVEQAKTTSMKVDPISHRTSSDPRPKSSNAAEVTAERAEANAAHHAGLYHAAKDPEARAHHKAEFQRWKKEAASKKAPSPAAGGKSESLTAAKQRLAKEPHAGVKLPADVKKKINIEYGARIREIADKSQKEGKSDTEGHSKETQAKLDRVYKEWDAKLDAAKKEAAKK